MKKKLLFLKLMAFAACLMCSMSAQAAVEAYANYTPSNGTLTFYYDNYRSSCTGPTYDLNQGTDMPAWYTIRSSVTRVVFNSSFANARPISTYCWFSMMSNLRTITGLQYLNTSYVTNMAAMFSGCSSLTSLNMNYSTFYTGKVTDMSDMFSGCSALTSLDVGILITTNVTNMTSMFSGCSNLTSLVLTGFSTAKVTDMSKMFQNCSRLVSLDMTGFNTMRVTNMSYMFSGCSSLPSVRVSFFITANVRDMSYMFDGCRALTTLDVTDFNTAKVTNMSRMFSNCNNLTSLDLGRFNTALVTNMSYMFQNCSYLTTIYAGDDWSTAAVTSSSGMFSGCTRLVGGKGTTYNSSHVNAEYAHIDGGPSNPGYFSGHEEAYAVYTPENTTLTFYYDEQRASRPGTTYSLNTGNNDTGWDTDGTKDYVTKVLFDPSFADARPTTTYDWFYKMQNLQSITGISYLNTSEVTNMAFMFHNCENLTSLDVSNFNTAKVTDMRYMFNNCSSLTTLDLSSFNTSNVTTMAHMFNGCYGLTSLDVSGFNTSNVTDMSYMFMWCEGLTTIYAGNGWNTNNVTNGSFMFYQCTRLVGGMGTTYDTNNTGVAYAHIDGGPSNPGYFSAAPEAYACYTESNTTFTFYYDNYRSSRQGTTYDLNVGDNQPAWPYDLYMNQSPSGEMPVTRVVFDPSFADARPKSTYYWFVGMLKLSSITGIEYLNTEKVTNMAYMFADCSSLTSIDVSNFNTAKVTDMSWLFSGCSGLTSLDLSNFNTAKVTDMYGMFAYDDKLATIVVGDGWNTSALTTSFYMFYECASLVGGMGTTFDENHIDAEYAHIDGGPSNPGYLSEKTTGKRGDVNGDGSVNIADVTSLIDYLLSGNASGVNIDAADCNQDSSVNISDVTSLIDYLLSGTWN